MSGKLSGDVFTQVLAARPGLEPGIAIPKTAVLPITPPGTTFTI